MVRQIKKIAKLISAKKKLLDVQGFVDKKTII